MPTDIFPARLDYVALGHLHGPQSLAGGRVRYSGSCFPLSASEIRYHHGVTLLDIHGRTVTATHLAIPWPAPVLRLPASGLTDLAGLEAELAAIKTDAAPDLRPLVYVELVAEDAPTVVLGKAEALFREAPVRTAGVRIHRLETKAADAAARPTVALSETDPETLFVHAFEAQNGFAPEARHLAAFRDAVGEV